MSKYENLCPAHKEVEFYNTCEFNCIYCISQTKELPPVKNIESILDEIRNTTDLNTPYYLSSWTDAYQEEERIKKNAQQVLQQLAKKDLPYFIITKSPLVLRDVEYFKNRPNAFIAMSINTVNNQVSNVLEPNAPLATERMNALARLCEMVEVKTVVKIDPLVPGITDGEILEELLDFITKIKPYAVTIETLRINKQIAKNLKEHLTNEMYNQMLKHYPELGEEPVHPDTEYRINNFHMVEKRLTGKGIKTSFCKATLPYAINKNDCRGGYD